jgi:hypothetical protein
MAVWRLLVACSAGSRLGSIFTRPLEMARLFTSGFELNSLTDGVEFFRGSSQSGAIVTTPVRSGTYAYQNKPAASIQNLQLSVGATAGTKTLYYKFAYYVTTQPATDTLVWFASADGITPCLRLRGTSTGLKVMNAANSQVGSSFSVSTGAWHIIKIKLLSHASAGTVDVFLDGSSVVSATGVGTSGGDLLIENFGSGVSVTHEYYIDDIAVNDGTGSFENSYPGDGKVIILHPTGAGDSTGWTPSTGANYTCVDEVTPNDATDYVSASTAVSDYYTCGASGIGSSDTVKVVHVGMRLANAVTDPSLLLKAQIKKATGGTASQSTAFGANTTTWRTNGASVTAYNPYPITLYQDPDSSAWTQATLDTMQIGQAITTVSTQSARVSTVWAMVDFTPSAGGFFARPYYELIGKAA